MYRSPELVNIGLGQLSEARKQTLLLDAIQKKEIAHASIETVKETIVPEMVVQTVSEVLHVENEQIRDMAIPSQPMENEAGIQPVVGETPVPLRPMEMPAPAIETLTATEEVTHATDTIYKEVVKEVAPVEMETLRTTGVEMVEPVIELPEVRNFAEVVSTDAAPVVIDTPSVETGEVVISNPAQTEMVSPELVVPIIDAPDVEVPTMNTVVESSAIPEIQSPMVDVAATEVASPSVDVSSPIVDMITPSVEVPGVKADERIYDADTKAFDGIRPLPNRVSEMASRQSDVPVVGGERTDILDAYAPAIQTPESQIIDVARRGSADDEHRRRIISYPGDSISDGQRRGNGSGIAKRGRVGSDCRCDDTIS